MRNWPSVRRLRRLRPLESLGPDQPPTAGDEANTVVPFLQCGGATYFLAAEAGFDPRPDGVQLLVAMHVPRGKVAFVKEIRVAPFIPPELSDPWNTQGAAPDPPTDFVVNLWRFWTSDPALTVRAAGTHGVWTTPFGWESYFFGEDLPPSWTWHLRLLPGNWQEVARRVTGGAPFSPAVPASWYLQPNVAVPVPGGPYASAGMPGQAPSGFWPNQRMQILQSDKLTTHVLVPEDTSLLLFARWTQAEFSPESFHAAGEGSNQGFYGENVYPLLPSFGQLHGYVQAADREASRENARHGWQG